MKKFLLGSGLVVSAISASVLFSGFGYAQGMGGPFGADGNNRMMQFFAKKLDLSDAQQAEIQAIMDNARENIDFEQKKDDFAATQAEVEKLVEADTLDTQALDQLAQSVGERAQQGFTQFVTIRHDINQVLTAEQRSKLQEMREKGGMWGRGGKGFGGFGGFGRFGGGWNSGE
ncbi:Spy/CpxP family protein refolding chaperone [Cardiobacteriaceae bacterium TAE3-ERU3]|nr:Spy/CpxP family protein refolding chaperone [Cardiobacteriaceae bacterium TAE3-ERU3]